MNTATRRIGILGGRFDPIHFGHLAVAAAARRRLGLERVLMVPSRVAPHRKQPAGAAGADRLAMVALAADGDPFLEACDLELTSDAPSYTATTLRRLRERGHPPTSLFFIVGADAFADIAAWRDYPRLLDAAHFAVVSRPGHPAAAVRDALPALRPRLRTAADDAGVSDRGPVPATAADNAGAPDRGPVLAAATDDAGAPDRGPVPATAADDVETPDRGSALATAADDAGTPDRGSALATAVFLIDAATPDISSTGIRKRLANGQSLEGHVPAAVAAYIDRRRLYPRKGGKRPA